MFNMKYEPRNSPFPTDVRVNLLWSQSGTLDNMPDCDHFVLLIAILITAARNMPSTDSMLTISKT